MTSAALAGAHRFATPWRLHGALIAGACALTLVLFARDARDIWAIWWTSSTFEHCLLVPPILGWLVWQRREALATTEPVAWWPGLLLVACGALLWILGEAGEMALARHLALLAMLQGAVVTLTGPAVSRVLLFPLTYAIFLIPFGAELVPPLQTATAAMAMGLLALSGPAATLDGVFITTPTGFFEVAEACAGVNFLIAMLAFATLAAHLLFTSWPRRIGFVLFALTASILANGARAWLTIVIADRAGIEFATGFDHIFYGWVFFAVVLAGVGAVGWRFAEPSRNRDRPTVAAKPVALAPTLAALAALVVAPSLWAATVAQAGREALPNAIELPEARGWARAPIAGLAWQPRYDGADHRLLGRYRHAGGATVDLAVAVYGWQGGGRELIGFGQGAAGGAWTWAADLAPPSGGKAERLRGPRNAARVAWTFYRVGDTLTGSATRVKLETARARLTGGSQAAVAITLSAADEATLTRFRRDLPPLDTLADAVVAQARGR